MLELKENIFKLLKKKENCCGCSACMAICPESAIYMYMDEEGFLYPNIDRDKCIRCDECKKVCAFKNK